MARIHLTVNGSSYSLPVEPGELLLDVLRDRLGLQGTKRGCGEGACGACTVLLDGQPILSCMTLAVRCEGREILTVEGLAPGSALHPLQVAALEHNAVQCGFCTPGWLLSAKALLDRNPAPAREEVRETLSGHLCRCTGYRRIEDAVLGAAAKLGGESSSGDGAG